MERNATLIKEYIKILRNEYDIEPNELSYTDGCIQILNKPAEVWHRDLWGWLADNPKKTKQDFVRLKFAENDGLRNLLRQSLCCFACLCDEIIANANCETPYCEYCPLTESFNELGDDGCGRISFVWQQSQASGSYAQATNYAKQIQSLKWK